MLVLRQREWNILLVHVSNKNEPIGVDELELMKEYAGVFGKGKGYHYYIFSKSGFTNGLKELAEKGEVRLVSLEDMYR